MVLFLAMFFSMRFLVLNGFVGWLLFEYNPNPPVWLTITGTVALILVVYGFISAIFFIGETARIIMIKIERGVSIHRGNSGKKEG